MNNQDDFNALIVAACDKILAAPREESFDGLLNTLLSTSNSPTAWSLAQSTWRAVEAMLSTPSTLVICSSRTRAHYWLMMSSHLYGMTLPTLLLVRNALAEARQIGTSRLVINGLKFLALHHQYRFDDAGALNYLCEGIELAHASDDSVHAQLWNNCGTCFMDIGALAESQRYLRVGLQVAAQQDSVAADLRLLHCNLAWSLAQDGNWVGARQAAEKVLALDPNDQSLADGPPLASALSLLVLSNVGFKNAVEARQILTRCVPTISKLVPSKSLAD